MPDSYPDSRFSTRPKGLVERVKCFIESEKMISRGDLVLVAFSGGPDSLALLHILNRLKGSLDFRLAAAHLDHGLRGEESRQEAEAAAALCKSWNISCRLGWWDGRKAREPGLSPEEGARKARLAFLEETAAELGAVSIATGHQQDDQVETILIRLLNGTGLTGLAGIRPVRPPYIRPLLEISRREILGYCRTWGLVYQEDSSNQKDCYLRNRLRHQVLPLLKKENPRFGQAISRMTALLRQEEDFLACLAQKALEELKMPDGQSLSLAGLQKLEPVLARRAVRLWLGGDTDAAGVERILNLAYRGSTGSQAEAAGGYRVRRGYTALELESLPGVSKSADSPPPQMLIHCLVLPFDPRAAGALLAGTFSREDFPGLTAFLQEAAGRNGRGEVREAYFCPWKKAWERPSLRCRRPGDWLLLPAGRKKLKDLLIDKKIPQKLRDRLPLLAWGDQVLWAPGLARGKSPCPPEECDCLLAFYR